MTITVSDHAIVRYCERTIRACIDALPIPQIQILHGATGVSQFEHSEVYRQRAKLALESLLPPPDPAREERERILGMLNGFAMRADEQEVSSSARTARYLAKKIANLDHHTAEG